MAEQVPDSFPSFDLTGKRALVTGATKGMGHHAALSLANAGADVFVTGRDGAELAETEAPIKSMGRRVASAPADLADPDAVERLGAQALEAMGGVDVLVNNAGVAHIEPFTETSLSAWDDTLSANLRAPYFLAKVVARSMVEAGSGGSIINISSQLGIIAPEGHGTYCASKARPSSSWPPTRRT